MLTFALFSGWEKVNTKQIVHSWAMGVLLMTIGIGGTVWAQQYVDSGFTSLLVCINPLIVLFLVWIIQKRAPRNKGILGVVLGIIGTFFLINQSNIVSESNSILGVIMILLSVFCWALGMVTIRYFDLPKNQAQSAGLQMCSAGITLLIISLGFGEFETFEPNKVPYTSWLALAYLILFGSAIAFTAYNYLLVKVNPEKVSTSAYVNPVIAVFLGWFFRNEPISGQTVFAGITMLLGVYFINSSK